MRDHDNTCPNRSQHTPCPAGYTAWHVWARKMGKTHYQITCPGCGRYSIWVPKSERHEQTRPAAAKHAQPCPQCGAEYPVVVPLWRWLKGDYRNKSLIQICTACGIAANTPPPEAATPRSEMAKKKRTAAERRRYQILCDLRRRISTIRIAQNRGHRQQLVFDLPQVSTTHFERGGWRNPTGRAWLHDGTDFFASGDDCELDLAEQIVRVLRRRA